MILIRGNLSRNDTFDGIKCFALSLIHLRQARRPRMGGVSKQRSVAEVHDQFRVVVEDDRPALELGTRNTLVKSKQCV